MCLDRSPSGAKAALLSGRLTGKGSLCESRFGGIVEYVAGHVEWFFRGSGTCVCVPLWPPHDHTGTVGGASVRVDTDAEQTRTSRGGYEHDGPCVCGRECTQTRLARLQ
jgi:hypothetical protein